jgi:hypothetical protein
VPRGLAVVEALLDELAVAAEHEVAGACVFRGVVEGGRKVG